jgi:ABC-type xylose transport system substrate-binding protein
MKKLFYILILFVGLNLVIGLTVTNSFGQTIELPRESAEKALRALETLPKVEAENVELKKLVKEMESAKLTPCAILINNFSDVMLKLPMPSSDSSKAENKAIFQLRKQTHDILKRSIQAECKWQSNSIWKELLKIAPIAAAILLK